MKELSLNPSSSSRSEAEQRAMLHLAETAPRNTQPIYDIAKIAETAYLLKQREIIERDPVLSDLEARLRSSSVAGLQGTTAEDIVQLMADAYPEVDQKYVLRAIEAYHPSPKKIHEDLNSIGSKPTTRVRLDAANKIASGFIRECINNLENNLPSLKFEYNHWRDDFYFGYVINQVSQEEKVSLFGLIKKQVKNKKKLFSIEYSDYSSCHNGEKRTIISLHDPRFTHVCKDVLKNLDLPNVKVSHSYPTD